MLEKIVKSLSRSFKRVTVVASLIGASLFAWYAPSAQAQVASPASSYMTNCAPSSQTVRGGQASNCLEQRATGESTATAQVHFPTYTKSSNRGYQLDAQDKSILNHLIQQNPGATFQVYGYTDSNGSTELNKRVGQYRADSVAAHFTTQGAQVGNITSYGESGPLASNTTTIGRALNRRVQVEVIPQAPVAKAAASPSSTSGATYTYTPSNTEEYRWLQPDDLEAVARIRGDCTAKHLTNSNACDAAVAESVHTHALRYQQLGYPDPKEVEIINGKLGVYETVLTSLEGRAVPYPVETTARDLRQQLQDARKESQTPGYETRMAVRLDDINRTADRLEEAVAAHMPTTKTLVIGDARFYANDATGDQADYIPCTAKNPCFALVDPNHATITVSQEEMPEKSDIIPQRKDTDPCVPLTSAVETLTRRGLLREVKYTGDVDQTRTAELCTNGYRHFGTIGYIQEASALKNDRASSTIYVTESAPVVTFGHQNTFESGLKAAQAMIELDQRYGSPQVSQADISQAAKLAQQKGTTYDAASATNTTTYDLGKTIQRALRQNPREVTIVIGTEDTSHYTLSEPDARKIAEQVYAMSGTQIKVTCVAPSCNEGLMRTLEILKQPVSPQRYTSR